MAFFWNEISRVFVAAVFIAAMVYWVIVLTDAIRSEPFDVGFRSIFNDVWATACFADYVAGLVLSLPLLYVVGPTPPSSVLWTLAQLILGNVVLLLRFTILVITQPDLYLAIQPHFTFLSNVPITTSRWVRLNLTLLRIACVIFGGLYLALVIRALVLESPQLGWNYIRSDPWIWMIFVDSYMGILFVAVYVAVREQRLIIWVPVVLVLIVCGNIVTCLYVLIATMVAVSATDALLARRSVITHRALYEPMA